MTENNEDHPLVTYALIAYNQERFVREAVEGAMAQTYSPMQLILSDDCSSDRTFKIMQEMVEDYSGPHEILLNCNESNLGIGAHINRVMELAEGELIVGGAGDDVSLPNRVTDTVYEWIKEGKPHASIFSSYLEIDAESNLVGEKKYSPNMVRNLQNSNKVVRHGYGVLGATHAWSKTLFSYFGPINNDIINEDTVIPLRAALIGKIVYIDKYLVKYRINVSTWHDHKGIPESLEEQLRRVRKLTTLNYAVVMQMLRDIALTDRKDLIFCAQARLAESMLALKIVENDRVTFSDFVCALGAGANLGYSIRICMKCFFPRIFWWYTRRRLLMGSSELL